MVRLVSSAVRSLAVPVSSTVAVDNVAILTSDEDVGAGDDDGVKVAVLGVAECCLAGEDDGSAGLER